MQFERRVGADAASSARLCSLDLREGDDRHLRHGEGAIEEDEQQQKHYVHAGSRPSRQTARGRGADQPKILAAGAGLCQQDTPDVSAYQPASSGGCWPRRQHFLDLDAQNEQSAQGFTRLSCAQSSCGWAMPGPDRGVIVDVHAAQRGVMQDLAVEVEKPCS